MTLTVQQNAQRGVKHPGFHKDRMIRNPYRSGVNLMLSPEAVAENIRIGEEFMQATPKERKILTEKYHMNPTDVTDLAQIAGIFGSKSDFDPYLVYRVGIKGLHTLSKGPTPDDLRYKVIDLLMHWLDSFWYQDKKPCINGLPPYNVILTAAVNGLNNLTIDIMHAKMLEEKGISAEPRLTALPTPRLVMILKHDKDFRDTQRHNIDVVSPNYVPPTLQEAEALHDEQDDATTIELEVAHAVVPTPPSLSGFSSAIADHSWATLGQSTNHIAPAVTTLEQALQKLEEKAEYLLINQGVMLQNIVDRVVREITERCIQAIEQRMTDIYEMSLRKGVAALREATHADQVLIGSLQEKSEQQQKDLTEAQEEIPRLLVTLEEKDKRLQEIKDIANLLLEPEK